MGFPFGDPQSSKLAIYLRAYLLKEGGKMKYRLALDIGIASVGWCVLVLDEKDNPYHIENLGVRKFVPAEVPKTGDSPAVQRRQARGIRRNIRRKKMRLLKLSAFLKDTILEGKDLTFVPCDIYKLRAEALDRELSNEELARVLYSIFKHRGFKSNRKSEVLNQGTEKELSAINANSKKVKNYRTVGEMFYKCSDYFEERERQVGDEIKKYRVYYIRNKADKESVNRTLLRDDILNEISTILGIQKRYNKLITPEFIEKIEHYFTYQKSYDEGPDFPSKYRVSFNVGHCTFFPEESRAPKGAFSYEYFTALCDINNLKINGRTLTKEEREKLIEAFLSNKEVKSDKIKKLLNIGENDRLTGKSGLDKKGRVIFKRPFSYDVLKILDLDNPLEHQDLIDEIARIFSLYKMDDRRLKELSQNELTRKIPQEKLSELLVLDTNKFGNLSIKALKLLLPHLEQGDIYTTAVENAGLEQKFGTRMKKLKYNLLPEIEDITSPVVKRSVSQTIKTVNAIIDRYGSPTSIYVELARDMSKSFEERKKIEREIDENLKNKEEIIKRLKEEFGILAPTSEDVLKFRLYEEQGGVCLYSGKELLKVLGSMANILSNNNTQVDHIIPYSRCYDDSYSNKVLVLSDENAMKGNRIPYEYFGHDEARWKSFEERILANKNISPKKKARLLKNSLSKAEEEELNSRALNDTRYISRFIKNLFENHLVFNGDNNRPVRTVNGSMTNFMRRLWRLPKNRFEDDKHHAVDACIIGCVDNGMVIRVSKYLQKCHTRKLKDRDVLIDKSTAEIFNDEMIIKEFGEDYQLPYPNFKEELLARTANDLSKETLIKLGYTEEEVESARPIFVSRMVNHKVTGAMHTETVRSKKLLDSNPGKLTAITKTSIKDLKIRRLPNGEFGDIENYPQKFIDDDPVLYKALRSRLIEFDGNAKLAFKEPFYKPSKSGKFMNEVKKVKLETAVGTVIEKNGGLVENKSMIRIDIYEKAGKFYLIPVYVIDYYNKKLPNRICKAHKIEAEWPELDDSYTFKFSLFQNDLIKLTSKNGFNFKPLDKKAEKESVNLNEIFVYYNSTDRSSAAINVQTVDGKYSCDGIGIQNLLLFEKYEVGILGDIHKIEKEKRKEFK